MFFAPSDLYEMLRFPRYSPELMKNLQDKKLRDLINHSYNTVTYYKELFDSLNLKPGDIKTTTDLNKVPVMSHGVFSDLPVSNILSNKIKPEKCRIVSTSGSAGIPRRIFFTKKDMGRINLNWARPLLENGARLRDKRIIFARPGLLGNKRWYQYFGIWRSLGLSVFEEPSFWIEEILRYRPDILYGYASVIEQLAAYMKKENLEITGPKKLFTVSDLLAEYSKNFIQDVFRQDVIDIYGAAETGCIAWYCPLCRTYHINSDTVIVEVIKDDNYKINDNNHGMENYGKIVVTNLHSFAMPIIRYELGDIVGLESDLPMCGRNLPGLKVIIGREDDFLVLPSGKLLSPRLFLELFQGLEYVSQWKVVQNKNSDLDIFIIPREKFKKESLFYFKDKIKELVKEKINIDFKIVEKIKKDPSGKVRGVMSYRISKQRTGFRKIYSKKI